MRSVWSVFLAKAALVSAKRVSASASSFLKSSTSWASHWLKRQGSIGSVVTADRRRPSSSSIVRARALSAVAKRCSAARRANSAAWACWFKSSRSRITEATVGEVSPPPSIDPAVKERAAVDWRAARASRSSSRARHSRVSCCTRSASDRSSSDEAFGLEPFPPLASHEPCDSRNAAPCASRGMEPWESRGAEPWESRSAAACESRNAEPWGSCNAEPFIWLNSACNWRFVRNNVAISRLNAAISRRRRSAAAPARSSPLSRAASPAPQRAEVA
mmetsp:Transcript_18755/g.51525  ORF Transcript_18755/g.51525 Transcript_18755/m.51525 type:complete len:274 (-) Transcript_18755:253-1074(-)